MSGMFKSKKQTVRQEALLTPQQQQMQALLAQLGGTGSAGGITLGQGYDGSLGNFDMSGMEDLANNKLLALLSGGANDQARNTLAGLTDTRFNPDDPSSGFSAFQRQLARSGQEGLDAINRDAAITGDRFSSSLGRQKVDLAERQNDILASQLAGLYNTQQDRAMSAAGMLEGLDQNRIGAGFQYGGLERLLKNAEAQAKMGEWQRARSEKLGQFDVAKNLLGQQFQWGVKEITKKSPSTFGAMMGEIMPMVGSYNTHKYGYNTNQSNLSDGVKMAMSLAGGI